MEYLTGFGNQFRTEAIKNSLPEKQNSPQKAPFGLYAEQISGAAFTAPRSHNLHTWFYRILPSVVQSDFKPIRSFTTPLAKPTPPNAMRWSPLPLPKQSTTFLAGLHFMAKNACGEIYHYAFNESMENDYFYSSDGDWLFVPEQGALAFKTECGTLAVEPTEIILIPRGIKWQVKLSSDIGRGYLLELQKGSFKLPELGPIGANGLAYPRHFLYPKAAFEDKRIECTLYNKFQDHLFSTTMDHSPLDVVAWHGNYAPYKYDLKLFNAINSVSFDHLDPSIFTVLTATSNTPGVAHIDFVIFPGRWLVSENTFRAPYFHRNIMNEYMGLVYGKYDAKSKAFQPGGASLHNCMTPHGPDADSTKKNINAKLEPVRYKDTLAFMFESHAIWEVSQSAYDSPLREKEYQNCWQNIERLFKG